MESSQSSFRQFSDDLRLETGNLSSFSLNDSIWSNSYAAVGKRSAVERRNFDFRNGGDAGSIFGAGSGKADLVPKVNDIESDLERLNLGFINDEWKAPVKNLGFVNEEWKAPVKDYAFNNDGWKTPFDNSFSGFGFTNDDWKSPIHDNRSTFGFDNSRWKNQENVSGFGWKSDDFSGLNNNVSNNVYSKGIYPSQSLNVKSYSKVKPGNFMNNVVDNSKINKHSENESYGGGKHGKKNKGARENNGNGNNENKNTVDKRFKTLPPAESLSRNERIGGYIFVCNNDTMAENLKRQLFGLPPRYRDSVRAITPGLPLFLYNYSTHQLHGIFEAATFGGSNIDPTAWEDKKNPGESRFPAQVRVITRKIFEPLEEDSFRPILHHYDGPKFRLELNIPEVLALLDIFAETNLGLQ